MSKFRAAFALAFVLAGCDDTLYPTVIVPYSPDWLGVQAFTVTACRECHCDKESETCGSSFEDVPFWPEDLQADRQCWDDVCIDPPQSCIDDGMTCDECRAELCGVYVIPGDPQNSYFWQMISGENLDGSVPQMPPNQPFKREQIEFVEEWILTGANL